MAKLVDVGSIGSYFESPSDPRHTRNRKHLLLRSLPAITRRGGPGHTHQGFTGRPTSLSVLEPHGPCPESETRFVLDPRGHGNDPVRNGPSEHKRQSRQGFPAGSLGPEPLAQGHRPSSPRPHGLASGVRLL